MNENDFIEVMRGNRGSVLFDGNNTTYAFYDGLFYFGSIESYEIFPEDHDWVLGCLSHLNGDPCLLEGHGDLCSAFRDYCGEYYPEADPVDIG